MQDLKKSFIRGMSWGIIDNLSGTGVNFLVGILLARLLSPEEFGIVGIALVLINISNVIIDGGLSNALIREEKVTEKDFKTVLTLSSGISVLLYLLFFFGAPLLADFYHLPELTLIIRVLLIVLLFNGLSIVPKTRFTKLLDFRSQAISSFSSSLLGAVVGITLIFLHWGIWALVAQQLVRQFVYAFSLWWQLRRFPQFSFERSRAVYFLSFGTRILLSALLDSLYNSLFYMLIGKLYSHRQLGLYTRAEQFSSILAINFGMVLQRVSLPVLTKSNQESQRLEKTFGKLLQFSTLFSALLCFSLAAIADHLILLLIGKQWNESAFILRILCFSAFFQPLIIIHQNILQVYHKPQLFLRLEIVKKIFSVTIVVCAITFGFTYLLWGIVIIALFSLILHSAYTHTQMPNFQQLQQFYAILRTILIVGGWSTIVYFGGQHVSNPYWSIILQLLLLAVGAFIILRFIYIEEYQQLYKLLKKKNI